MHFLEEGGGANEIKHKEKNVFFFSLFSKHKRVRWQHQSLIKRSLFFPNFFYKYEQDRNGIHIAVIKRAFFFS